MIEPFKALLLKVQDALECLREPPKEWNESWSRVPYGKVAEVGREAHTILLNPQLYVPGTAAVLDREPHTMDSRVRDCFISTGELFAASSLLEKTLLTSYYDDNCDEPRASMERWSPALCHNILEAIEEFRSASLLLRQNIEANAY